MSGIDFRQQGAGSKFHFSTKSKLFVPAREAAGGSLTALLANFEGVDAQTSYTDDLGVPWNLNLFSLGTSELDDALKPFGNTSLAGTLSNTMWVGQDTHTVLAAGESAGPITWEAFVYVHSGPITFSVATNGFGERISISITTSGTTILTTGAGLSSTDAVAVDTWHHVAICLDGAGNNDLFLNGNRIAQATGQPPPTSDIEGDNAARCYLHGTAGSNNGSIKGIRLSKTVRYSGATYTVPSAVFVAD